MADLILYAIPAFVLLLAVELWSFRIAADEDLVGYEARDTRTSLAMGGGNVVINAVWKLVVVVVYAGLYELTPLRMSADEWWTYVVLFFADDFAYYWWPGRAPLGPGVGRRAGRGRLPRRAVVSGGRVANPRAAAAALRHGQPLQAGQLRPLQGPQLRVDRRDAGGRRRRGGPCRRRPGAGWAGAAVGPAPARAAGDDRQGRALRDRAVDAQPAGLDPRGPAGARRRSFIAAALFGAVCLVLPGLEAEADSGRGRRQVLAEVLGGEGGSAEQMLEASGIDADGRRHLERWAEGEFTLSERERWRLSSGGEPRRS